MKAIKGADGETEKHGRLKRIMFFDSYRKRARFLDPVVIAERAKRVAAAAKAKEKSERGARNAEEKPEAGANKPK